MRHRLHDLATLWAEVSRRWWPSPDPELRTRAAQARVNQGFVALQAGDERTARRMFATVVGRFGAAGFLSDGEDGELQRWLTIAHHAEGIVDRLMIGEPEFELGYLRRQRQWYPHSPLEEVVDLARGVHVRSVGLVQVWLCGAQPFVLLLRNFGLTERSGIRSPESWFEDKDKTGDHVRVIHYRDAGPVLRELASGVALVQAASTTAGELEVDDLGGDAAAVRLYLASATWFETVSKLIARGRAGETLILLERPPGDDPTAGLLPRRAGEPLSLDHPALEPFPYRVNAAELGGRSLAECPALTRLVDRLGEAATEPLGPRLQRITACLDETGHG